MKKLLIFLIIISAGIGIFYYQETAICRNPLSYDIVNFDTHFGISKDKFIATVQESETIWEKGVGRDLFAYKPGGKLKINLVYDDRQVTTQEAVQSQEQIETSRAAYDSLSSQYKSLETAYKSDLSAYDYQVSRFEQQLDLYNTKVAEANKKGGATPKEYEQLQQEKRYLEDLKTELERDRVALNTEASRLNYLGDQVNQLARRLNITVDIHNERFGEAREFDQGDYINNKISVYQFEGIADLRLVLAHELGHALGIGHVDNPKSIMYYLMEKQDLNNPALTQEDKNALIERCQFRIPKLQELLN